MKKSILFLGVLCSSVLFMPLASFAGSVLLDGEPSYKATGIYIGFSGGVSMNHDSDLDIDGIPAIIEVEYDTGYGYNIAAGYNFNPIRIEAEFGYRNADVDTLSAAGVSVDVDNIELTTKSYMLNGYYDFKVETPIKPFLGVGLGMINGEIDVDGYDADDDVFGYQLTAGITASHKNMNLDLYYRFQAAGEDFDKEDVKLEYANSSVFLGIRYHF